MEAQHRFTGSLTATWLDANNGVLGQSVIPFVTVAIPDVDSEEVVNWELGQITLGSSRFAGQIFVGNCPFDSVANLWWQLRRGMPVSGQNLETGIAAAW